MGKRYIIISYLIITAYIVAQVVPPTYAFFSYTPQVIDSKILAAFVFPKTIKQLEEDIEDRLSNISRIGSSAKEAYEKSIQSATSEETSMYISEIEYLLMEANGNYQVAFEKENELESYYSRALYEVERDESAIVLLEMIESSFTASQNMLTQMESFISEIETFLTLTKIELERQEQAEEEARIEQEKQKQAEEEARIEQEKQEQAEEEARIEQEKQKQAEEEARKELEKQKLAEEEEALKKEENALEEEDNQHNDNNEQILPEIPLDEGEELILAEEVDEEATEEKATNEEEGDSDFNRYLEEQ